MPDRKETTPNAIKLHVSMDKPNQQIDAFRGQFEIVQGELRLRVDGSIFFDWFPSPGLRFNGNLIDSAHPDYLSIGDSVEIIVNSTSIGRGQFSSLSASADLAIEGKLNGSVVLGEKSIPVSEVHFAVPNLREFFGASVKRVNGDKVSFERGRLVFANDAYIITLDKISAYGELQKSVVRSGGYVFLYSGTIESKRGQIQSAALHDLVKSFSFFISFLNGRRCSPTILTGSHNNEAIWTDFSGYLSDSYKNVPSWPSHMDVTGLNELWEQWCELMKDASGQDFLTTAVHWYLEANSNAGLVEGAIILTQTALELIYNWFVVEKLGLLQGGDSHNISAANKIRLLLNEIRVPFDIPASLTRLTTFKNSLTAQADGPECFVRIRNAIVHSQEEKREFLQTVPLLTRYESLQLGLWYVELALLKILGFRETYNNRCKIGGWAGASDEKVPWGKDSVP